MVGDLASSHRQSLVITGDRTFQLEPSGNNPIPFAGSQEDNVVGEASFGEGTLEV